MDNLCKEQNIQTYNRYIHMYVYITERDELNTAMKLQEVYELKSFSSFVFVKLIASKSKTLSQQKEERERERGEVYNLLGVGHRPGTHAMWWVVWGPVYTKRRYVVSFTFASVEVSSQGSGHQLSTPQIPVRNEILINKKNNIFQIYVNFFITNYVNNYN